MKNKQAGNKTVVIASGELDALLKTAQLVARMYKRGFLTRADIDDLKAAADKAGVRYEAQKAA